MKKQDFVTFFCRLKKSDSPYVSTFVMFFLIMAAFVLNVAVADTIDTKETDSHNSKLQALLVAHKYVPANVGVLFRDIDTDSTFASLNADVMYNPASVAKLLTTAIAFDKLGSSFTFKTSVYCGSGFKPESGVCAGNLYIIGGGDPSLVIERLWLFVQHLKCIGVKSIERDIVLDNSLFDSVTVGPGFYEDSSDDPYMAPVSALSANFNCTSVWLRPGANAGAPAYADILPKAKTVSLVNRAKTLGNKLLDWIIASRREPNTTDVKVSGGIGIDSKQVVEYRKVWQTWEYFGDVFKNLLDENHIAFTGAIRHGVTPDSVKQKEPLYVFPSIPLSDIITDMLKYSSNYTAETIFKTLSAAPGSWEKSAALATSWWKEKRISATCPLVKNGSGMGESNKMSCRQITDLLAYLYRQKSTMPELLYALPCAGIDGTLKSRFKNSRFKGIIRGKTGTLNDYGISTIAGYIFLPKRTLTFAILFNNCTHHKHYQLWEMQERILEAVVPEK
jgi:D-alanyl-D-alanine carboxypeptidase/D-alanyl-D-alanine-endopeptidase (penicillin-binding protein 4)